MKVYFAHSFSGAREGSALRNSKDPKIIAFLHALDLIPVIVCDPAETPIPVGDYAGRFEYCLTQIEQSGALVIDATNRLGLGVGAEMMFAKNIGVPVFAICPMNSHYRREDGVETTEWIHPFIYGLTTNICISFEECAEALIQLTHEGELNA